MAFAIITKLKYDTVSYRRSSNASW